MTTATMNQTMSELQKLKTQAARIGAVVICADKCGFKERFEEYLDRDSRVDEEAETVEFGCPECGAESVDLGKRQQNLPPTIIVSGLEEINEVME